MMARDAPSVPPGIHHAYHGEEQHWHQPAAKNLTQGWWPQAAGYNVSQMVASPPVPDYNPQMFFNEAGNTAYPHYQQHAMRTNSFPMSPIDAYGGHVNAAPPRNASQQHTAGYFNTIIAPQQQTHAHPNAFMSHPHQQHHHLFGHEHGMISPMHTQMPTFQPVFNKTGPNKGHFGHSPWAPAMKAPMLPMSMVNTRSKIISPSRVSNGQISPTSFRRGSMQRVDSVVEMSAPRGPPRKPKQSGFALWVGNLPFNADIIALKDHFSRDAREDIESLCLLATSSCAFVNYRSEEAVNAAHHRFNNSRFGPVRLLCRVRNGKEHKATGHTISPAASAPSQPQSENPADDVAVNLAELSLSKSSSTEEASQTDAATPNQKRGDRYFIVKSLTLQDLQMSCKNGLWETQPHNRAMLDEAFDAADNVYLVYSVNKSGEYFGYARMTSRSFEPGTSETETASEVEVDHNAGLHITPTSATETAPKGHIVKDVIRGTMFWEADHDEAADVKNTEAADKQTGDAKAFEEPQSRQFRVEWRSTQCVPFRRTKGMRNLWNDNKEVKVARDGTELETEVGKLLVGLFHGPGDIAGRPSERVSE